MNSMIEAFTVLSGVNAALLLFGAVVALIMAAHFRKSTLEQDLSRFFFYAMLAAVFTMVAGAAALRHPHPHDLLFSALTVISRLGFCAVMYLYIPYVAAAVRVHGGGPVKKSLLGCALVLCAAGTVLQIFTILVKELPAGTAAYNSPLFWAARIFEAAVLAMVVLILFRQRGSMSAHYVRVLMTVPVFALAASIAEPLAKGVLLRYPAVISGALIVFTQYHLEIEHSAKKKEVTSLQNRLLLAAGRMKPHYIGNILTSIYYLCDMDPGEAQNAVGALSEYLRNTLETIENPEPVPFTWELNQIRNYLALEKMRFEERLRVYYDIDVDNFDIPPLSIQPLVENAVKRGIAGLDRPGSVRIETRRTADGVLIRVIDDGVGFDSTQVSHSDDETHIGLSDLSERIRVERGGDMTVESSPGKGTTVTVRLNLK